MSVSLIFFFLQNNANGKTVSNEPKKSLHKLSGKGITLIHVLIIRRSSSHNYCVPIIRVLISTYNSTG